MNYYSFWPFVLCMAILLAVAELPLFAAADTPPHPQPHRLNTLDGLRGLLAFAVFFHHAAIYHGYLLTGEWTYPPSRFYTNLGPSAVRLFFMITGFLFGMRLIQPKTTQNWPGFYVGRVFRIGPLFLMAFALMLCIVLGGTGLALHVPSWTFLKSLLPMPALGLLEIHDINGYLQTNLLLDDVTWTLRYEWLFYLVLPLIGVCIIDRPYYRRILAGLLAVCFAVSFFHVSGTRVAGSFLCGMLCGSLKLDQVRLPISNTVGSCAIVVLLGLSLSVPDKIQPISFFCLGTTFYLVTSGCTVFGLLTTRAARRLGDISYGIYLLQGLPQALVFRPKRLSLFALASPLHHWILTLSAAILLIILATLAHVAVELRGVELGTRITRRLAMKH